jgi:GNAT superfamily N-acetyltransferase
MAVFAIRGDTYWGKWPTVEQLETGFSNSLLIGAYTDDAIGLHGFARIVSDKATFSAVTDLYVYPQYRRQGIGTKIMQAVVEHEHVARTICILHTRDAGKFYEKFGFRHLGGSVYQRDPQ